MYQIVSMFNIKPLTTFLALNRKKNWVTPRRVNPRRNRLLLPSSSPVSPLPPPPRRRGLLLPHLAPASSSPATRPSPVTRPGARRPLRPGAHFPGAACARHSPSKADRDAEAASATASVLATLLELRDSADDLCLAVVAKKKATFDPNVMAYETSAIHEGGRSTVVERGGAGDEQGASEFVLDETARPDGGSCVTQLDAGVGIQLGVGVEMQLQSLPLLLAALLCRSGEGFPAMQTRYHGSRWGHSLHALGTLSLTLTSTTSPPSAGSFSPLQLGRS